MAVYVHRNLYVDDGLTSLPMLEEAVDLRLHKVASKSCHGTDALPAADRANL